MPFETVNGMRLYYEEHGAGDTILCIHGTGSAGYAWSDAAGKLAALGRVVVYDRRGFTRSELPEPYEVTNVAEHTDDAHELLRLLDAEPAVVVGRSYGGSIALDLALRYPESVRALALLEAVPFGLSPELDGWAGDLTEKAERAAAERGMDAVGETMLREALGEWETLPAPLRELFTANGPAILAETRGGELTVSRERLAQIRVPTLVVSSAGSADELRRVSEVLVEAIPEAQSLRVAGGHLIDPADPGILAFVAEVRAGT